MHWFGATPQSGARPRPSGNENHYYLDLRVQIGMRALMRISLIKFVACKKITYKTESNKLSTLEKTNINPNAL